MTKTHGGSFKLYKTYSFTSKDPIIDKLRGIIQDEGVSYASLAAGSGVSESTLYQWFHGKTLRPQFASIMAVTRELKYDLALVKVEAKGSAKIIVFKPKQRKAA